MRANLGQPTSFKDCICSEISENLRINIREKTEVSRSSRSPSPEVTHTIRIAMKYHGQAERKSSDGKDVAHEECERQCKEESEKSDRDDEQFGTNKYFNMREDACCPGVNVALDFTLNCSSVQLTSRDISLKTSASSATRNTKSAE